MWLLALSIAAKLVSLAGAMAQTAGFLTFFALESLLPYRWPLILGGTVVIVLGESLHYLITRKFTSPPQHDQTS
jgi:hypothetical protein